MSVLNTSINIMTIVCGIIHTVIHEATFYPIKLERSLKSIVEVVCSIFASCLP